MAHIARLATIVVGLGMIAVSLTVIAVTTTRANDTTGEGERKQQQCDQCPFHLVLQQG